MHLIVIQHGLWGQPANTAYLSTLLRERLGEGYDILNSDVNRGNLTYDGIDVCGDRLHALILASMDTLAANGKPVTAISMIGYSMGGLVTRYVAGKLYAEGRFATVTPVNFITIATPHLGAWRMPSTWYNRAFNFMVPVVTSRSGYQLVFQDKHTWGKPLLCLLSHPDLPFLRALRGFRKLMLLANVFHDRPVPYCTAAVRLDNPYERSPPVAIDPKYPCIVTTAATATAAALAFVGAAAVAAGEVAAAAEADGLEAGAGPAKTYGPTIVGEVAAGATAVMASAVQAVATPLHPTEGTTTITTSNNNNNNVSNSDGSGLALSSGSDQDQQTKAQQVPQSLASKPAPSSPTQQPPQAWQHPQQQHPQQEQQQQVQPQRPLRGKYIPVLSVLCLPVLLLPALAFMVATGRSHHCKMMRTALDFSWIQRHHQHHRNRKRNKLAVSERKQLTQTQQEQQGGSGSHTEIDDILPGDEYNGTADGGDDTIECPSAPEIPVRSQPPTSAIAGNGATGGATGAVAAAAAAAGGSTRSTPSGVSAAPAGATAVGALDDGCDEVVVSEQVEVLLHDGVVELPEGLHRLQEWLAEQLNQLPWHKVDVDCRDWHAHAAIINRNPLRFAHTRDVLEYLADNFVRS